MASFSLCVEGGIWDQESDAMYGDKECGPYSTLQRRTPYQQYRCELVGRYYSYQIVHNKALQIKGPMANKIFPMYR